MGAGASSKASDDDANWMKEMNDLITIDQLGEEIEGVSHFHRLYAKYFPFSIVDRFKTLPNGLTKPKMYSFDAAVAFVDISGFTALSEKLIKLYGTAGAEYLNVSISGYFEKLINVIVNFGGDIIKFAGDAMLVVFRNPVVDGRRESSSTKKFGKNLGNIFGDDGHNLRMLALRGVACNVALNTKFNNFEIDAIPGLKLKLHSGIGVGKMFGVYVGGSKMPDDSEAWEYYVAGEPIEQMSIACDEASSGQVVISKQTADLLGNVVQGKRIPKTQSLLVSQLLDTPHFSRYSPPVISDESGKHMLGFVQSVVKSKGELALDTRTLSEFRKVYIMFIAMPDIDYEGDKDVLQRMQNVTLAVQGSVFRHNGTIARLLADDKGTRFKIAFGMPSQTHEDDAIRVVRAGLEIQEKLRELEVLNYIGVATGTVFCGQAGSDLRCEYTAVGFKVNMAARLMQAAKKYNTMFMVDELTCRAASGAVVFEKYREDIPLKGIKEPVPVFTPRMFLSKMQKGGGKMGKLFAEMTGGNTGKKGGPTEAGPKSVAATSNAANALRHHRGMSRTPANAKKRKHSIPMLAKMGHTRRELMNGEPTELGLVGRTEEMGEIQAALHEVVVSGKTRIVLLEGLSGIGKTALVTHFLKKISAEQEEVDFAYGAGDTTEKRTPYFAWRSIFEQLVGCEGSRSRKRNQVVETLLKDNEKLLSLKPLLNPILGTTFKDYMADSTSAVQRAKQIKTMLLALLQLTALPNDNAPALVETRVIVIEDMQLVDSGTWELIVEVVMQLPSLLVLVTHRPFESSITHHSKLLKTPGCLALTLEEMSQEEAAKLGAVSAGVAELPHELTGIIWNVSRGNALFIEELVRSMLARELIHIDDGEVIIGEKLTLEGSYKLFPENVQALITGRIDRLQPNTEQLLIKLGAIIGSDVPLEILVKLLPVTFVPKGEDPKEYCRAILRPLAANGLLVLNKDEAFESFVFRHGNLVKAAKDMSSVAQKKHLHAKIADYYIQKYKGNHQQLLPFMSTLIEHLVESQQWEKCIRYKIQSGKAAMVINANHEAIKSFDSALGLIKKHTPQDTRRRDVCQNSIAWAHYRRGEYHKAIPRLEALVSSLHLNLKKSTTSVYMLLIRETLSRKKSHANLKIVDDPNEDKYGSWVPSFNTASLVKEEAAARMSPGDRAVAPAAQIISVDDKQVDDMSKATELRKIYLLRRLSRCYSETGMNMKSVSCCFKMVRIAEKLCLASVLGRVYSQTAYTCLQLRWTRLGVYYASRARKVLDLKQKSSTLISRTAAAEIYFDQSFIYGYYGSWKEAGDMLGLAQKYFKQDIDKNKMWRESTFYLCCSKFYSGNFKEAFKGFRRVVTSAQEDGDMYLEAFGIFWMANCSYILHGPSLPVTQSLQAASSIGDTLKLNMSQQLSFMTSAASNRFHLSRKKGQQLQQSLQLPNRLSTQLPYLGTPPNLLQNCYPLQSFCSLLLDGCEHTQFKIDQKRLQNNPPQNMPSSYCLPYNASSSVNISGKTNLFSPSTVARASAEMPGGQDGNRSLVRMKTKAALLGSSESKKKKSAKVRPWEKDSQPRPRKKSPTVKTLAYPQKFGALKKTTKKAVAKLFGFARKFSYAKCAAHLAEGRLQWVNGSHSKAISSWGKALRAAEACGMWYFVALAEYQLGSHVAVNVNSPQANSSDVEWLEAIGLEDSDEEDANDFSRKERKVRRMEEPKKNLSVNKNPKSRLRTMLKFPTSDESKTSPSPTPSLRVKANIHREQQDVTKHTMAKSLSHLYRCWCILQALGVEYVAHPQFHLLHNVPAYPGDPDEPPNQSANEFMHRFALRPIWLDFDQFCNELETIRSDQSSVTHDILTSSAQKRAYTTESKLAELSHKSGAGDKPSLLDQPSAVFTRAFSLRTMAKLEATGPKLPTVKDNHLEDGGELPGTTIAASPTVAKPAAPTSDVEKSPLSKTDLQPSPSSSPVVTMHMPLEGRT